LEFFDVLLNDGPPLEPSLTFYQRLLARDQDEAVQIVQTFVKAHPPENIYDELLVPALISAERDDITDGEEDFILRATREIVEDLEETSALPAERVDPSQNGKGGHVPGNPTWLGIRCLRRFLFLPPCAG
jgi:hypothetical protein